MTENNFEEYSITDLWHTYNDTKREDVKHEIARRYFPYVKTIAYSLAEKLRWNSRPEELASFGVDGLYKAIDGYDISRGYKFESYANQRIRGSMIDNLRREDFVPRSVRLTSEQFNTHRQRMENHMGHRISNVEFVSLIGMDETEFHKHFRRYVALTPSTLDSLDTDEEDGSQTSIKQDSNTYLCDKQAEDPETSSRRQEFLSKLIGNDLSPIERNIIYLHYYKGWTMKRIAKKIRKSESRVSQIHKATIDKLHNKVTRNPEYFDNYIMEFLKSGTAEATASE